MHAAEPQVPRVPDHIEEGNCAGPALRRVHPVSRPRIFANVTFPAIPDVKAVERVIKNRQPNSEKLKPNHEWKAAQKFDLLGVRAWAFGCEGVREKMFD